MSPTSLIAQLFQTLLDTHTPTGNTLPLHSLHILPPTQLPLPIKASVDLQDSSFKTAEPPSNFHLPQTATNSASQVQILSIIFHLLTSTLLVEHALNALDIPLTLMVNVLLHALLIHSIMEVLALLAKTVKHGMELPVLTDALMVKYGIPILETVFVLQAAIGMEAAVLLAIMVKYGVHTQIHALVHLQPTGMDMCALLAQVDKSGAQVHYLVFVLLIINGMVLLVHPSHALLVNSTILQQPHAPAPQDHIGLDHPAQLALLDLFGIVKSINAVAHQDMYSSKVSVL